MSKFRKQLDGLRDAYRSEKYPGDLAGELLGVARSLDPKAGGENSRRGWRIWLAGVAGVGAAAAAAVTIVSLMNRPGVQVIQPGGEGQEIAVQFEIPGRHEMPSGLPVVPPYVGVGELTGAPEFPSRFGTL